MEKRKKENGNHALQAKRKKEKKYEKRAIRRSEKKFIRSLMTADDIFQSAIRFQLDN